MTNKDAHVRNRGDDASRSSIHLCPICNCGFFGDQPAFEKHVNDHLDGINEAQEDASTIADLVANDDNRESQESFSRQSINQHQDRNNGCDSEYHTTADDAAALALAVEVAERADQMSADLNLAHLFQATEQEDAITTLSSSLAQHYDDSKSDTVELIDDIELECEVSTCGETVKFSEMQRHMDHHLAQQLAQTWELDVFATSAADTVHDVDKGDNMTLRILKDDGTFENIVVKRPLDDIDKGNTSDGKKMRLLPESQLSPSSPANHQYRHIVKSPTRLSPPSSPSTADVLNQTSGQTTMDGFLRRSVSSSTSSTSSSVTVLETNIGGRDRFTFLSPASSEIYSGLMPGLIPRLATLLQASIDAKATHAAYLAHPSVVFCPSNLSDKGWGCGYRNIQMMLSYVVQQPSVMHHHRQHYQHTLATVADNNRLDHIPTIPQLQHQLEYAWRELGIDPQGASQLQHKVVGTHKWIGTTEAWTVFTSLGIRAEILDFHQPTGPNNTHPALFQAVLDYFQAPPSVSLQPPSAPTLADGTGTTRTTFATQGGWASGDEIRKGVVQTRKPPLYMQHQGHSRTIVGIEILRPGVYSLLVFDPGRKVPPGFLQVPPMRMTDGHTQVQASTTLKLDRSLLRSFRLWLATGYTKAQYSLLGISGLHTLEREQQQSHSQHINGRITPSRSHDEKNKLALLTPNTALSFGWSDKERQETKHPSSHRIP